MIKKAYLAAGSVAALRLMAAGEPALAQQAGPPPPGVGEQVIMNLGQAGLMAAMNSYEDFGTVQSRIGQSRAQIEASRATGVTTGYKDSANIGVLPFDVFYALPGSNGTSFVKVGGLALFNRGDHNQTELYARTGRLEAEYFRAPTKDTLLGLGAIVEKTKVDMYHNDGTTEDLGYGVRGDLVHKFNRHWGIAARAEYLWSTGETRIPIGGGINYGYNEKWGRLYTQANLVGSYTRDTLGFIPKGWVFHPTIGALYERNHFNDVLDTFGQIVNGTVGPNDNYATISANARFESMNLRPMHIAPYVDFGVEREVKNDLNLITNDPTILHSVVGASLNMGGGAMVNFEYGRHDGLKGERRDQALTLHVGVVF